MSLIKCPDGELACSVKQAIAGPPAPAPSADLGARLAQLAQLGDLMTAGVLTEAKFQQQKARILHG